MCFPLLEEDRMPAVEDSEKVTGLDTALRAYSTLSR
jgi:hypothetical protein